MLFVLLVLGSVALYAMTPAERIRFFQSSLATLHRLLAGIEEHRAQPDGFREALCARTPRTVVMPALVALQVVFFFCIVLGPGALGDPETLVGWGASFAPRTTNGEWGRLVLAIFVQAGFLQLLVNIVGILQLGLVVERLVGPLAFGATFVSAGVLANLVGLSSHAVEVTYGPSGAIFGLYGLAAPALVVLWRRRSEVTVPLRTIRKLAPAAVIFTLYNLASGTLPTDAELAGLCVGVISGLFLTRTIGDGKPAPRLVAASLATALVVAFVSAVLLRGVADVRPEIARVVAVEQETASTYRTAVDRFRRGRISLDALIQLIEGTIVPEIQAADARVKALEGVPREHRSLVADAQEYLRLRHESWRLRSEGLREANMATLRKAEGTERASLEALKRLNPSDEKKQG
jgi:membrane associated rhomboid family serine protease